MNDLLLSVQIPKSEIICLRIIEILYIQLVL